MNKHFSVLFFAICYLLNLTAIFSGCATLPARRAYVSNQDYISGENDLKITVVDVGQGECIHIQTPNGRQILLDGGGIPSWKGPQDSLQKYVLSFIRKKIKGKGALDAVIMSHPHADHIGGLVAVLRDIPVKIVYDSGYQHGDPEYLTCLNIIKEKNIPLQTVADGDLIDIDPDLEIKILSPPSDFQFEGANNNSIVLKLTYKEFSMLLTGDIEMEAENYIVAKHKNKLLANVLKSPHHGSRSSSTPALMRAVRPELVIISCGRDNQFGHPHPEILSRYRSYGAQVLRTDYDGDITITTNGFSFTVTTSEK